MQFLALKAKGKTCRGMQGVTEKGAEALQEVGESVLLEMGITAPEAEWSATMAGYVTATNLAKHRGVAQVAALFSDAGGRGER